MTLFRLEEMQSLPRTDINNISKPCLIKISLFYHIYFVTPLNLVPENYPWYRFAYPITNFYLIELCFNNTEIIKSEMSKSSFFSLGQVYYKMNFEQLQRAITAIEDGEVMALFFCFFMFVHFHFVPHSKRSFLK